jgi:hypothetical protein
MIMGRFLARLVIAAAITALFATSAFAENLFGPPGLDTTYGVLIRLRQEIMEKNFYLNTVEKPDRDFIRLRSSVFVKFDYEKKYDLMIKLTNEMKYYLDFAASYRSNDHFYDPDELLFDSLYMTFYNAFGLPVDVRAGRQDLMLGDGFLVMDGTPGDGSRTLFFNAIKGTVKFSKNHNLDLIFISDQKTDTHLTVLYDDIYGKKVLNSSNEQAFIVYSHNQLNDNILIEPYYMYKREEAFGSTPELDLKTFGGRAVLKYAPWTIKGEFAYQTGEYDNGLSRRAFGGHAEVAAKFENVMLKPEFEIGFVTLSGDDPGTTDKVEAWDPLFSRWPMWSDLFVFTLLPETGSYGVTPAYWTNLQIYRASAKFNFTPQTNLQIWYNYLRSNELTNIASPMFSNNNKERGHLPQAKLYHMFNKNIDGFLQVEYFIPGNFYGPTADNALFFRAQLGFKF